MDEQTETMKEEQLRAAIGPNAHYVAETGSTNELLQQMAAAGAPAGTLVLADFQRTGKGRLNRRWRAPAGTSLLFSYLFRPDWPASRAPWLTMMAGLAAVEAIEEMTAHLAPALKWPNDIMLATGDGWAKVGGILLETVISEDRLEQAIVGMGLNVNIPKAALPATATPATSLLLAKGGPVARLPLLSRLVARLEHHYEAAGRGESPQPEWNERLLKGAVVMASGGGAGRLTGRMLGTDEWGRLLLETVDGTVHTVAGGDITLRPAGRGE